MRFPLSRRSPLRVLSLGCLLAGVMTSGGPGSFPERTALLAQDSEPGGPEAKGPAAPASGPKRRAAEPVEVLPRTGRNSAPKPLEPGEVHLLAILQALADSAGSTVVYSAGSEAGQEILVLKSRLERPDRASLISLLTRQGYPVSEETYNGRRVLFVSRQLKPTNRRGAILRSGDEPASAGPSSAAGADPREPAAGGGPVRLFIQGEGQSRAYLVLFETANREEAEDARKLLESFRESRRAKKGR